MDENNSTTSCCCVLQEADDDDQSIRIKAYQNKTGRRAAKQKDLTTFGRKTNICLVNLCFIYRDGELFTLQDLKDLTEVTKNIAREDSICKMSAALETLFDCFYLLGSKVIHLFC